MVLLLDTAEDRDGLLQRVVVQLQRVWYLLSESWPRNCLLCTKQICVEFLWLHHLVRRPVFLLLNLIQYVNLLNVTTVEGKLEDLLLVLSQQL